MKHQSIHDLFHYWNDLRGERLAPERNDIDPNAIRHILADTFMLAIDPDRTFPFRLAGTRVNALFDAEQKGQSFLRLWRPEEARNLAAVLTTVADGACPVVAGVAAVSPGHAETAFELLLLPLRHNGKTHARIFGMIKAVKDPALLGLLPIGPLNLRSVRVIENDEVWAATDRHRTTSAVRPATDRRTMIRRAPQEQPRLRVIQGGSIAANAIYSPARAALKVLEVEVKNSHL